MKKFLTKVLFALCLIILPCTIVLTGCDETGNLPNEEIVTALTNAEKLAKIEKYLNGKTELSDEEKTELDFNSDNKVTKEDYSLLKIYLNNYDSNRDGEFSFPYTTAKTGDINLDGVVDAKDKLMLVNYFKYFDPDTKKPTKSEFALNLKQLFNADVNLNGEVNSNDLTAFDELTNNLYAYIVDDVDLAKIVFYQNNADFNNDGVVDSEDTRLFKMIALYYDAEKDTNFSLPYEDVLTGDVNLDGRVDLEDLDLLKSYLEGSISTRLSLKALINADVDGNAIVNEADVDADNFYENVMGVKKLNELIDSLENGEKSFNINFDLIDENNYLADNPMDTLKGKTTYTYDKTSQVSYSRDPMLSNIYVDGVMKVQKVADNGYVRFAGGVNSSELEAKYIVSAGEVSRLWTIYQPYVRAVNSLDKLNDQNLISVVMSSTTSGTKSVKITFRDNNEYVYECTYTFTENDLLSATIKMTDVSTSSSFGRAVTLVYTFETETSTTNFATKIDEFDAIYSTTGEATEKGKISIGLNINGKEYSWYIADNQHSDCVYLEYDKPLKSALNAELKKLTEAGATIATTSGAQPIIPEGKEIDKIYIVRRYGDCDDNYYEERIEVTDDFILRSWMNFRYVYHADEWLQVDVTFKDIVTAE